MSCKSALYGANTASQTVAVNGSINFGSIVRRYGCNCNLANGVITLVGSGYYDIDTNLTFTATDTLTTIALFKDGTAIPGATVTLTTVAGSVYTVSIPTMVRQICNCETNVSAVVTVGGATVTNASVVIEKL